MTPHDVLATILAEALKRYDEADRYRREMHQATKGRVGSVVRGTKRGAKAVYLAGAILHELPDYDLAIIPESLMSQSEPRPSGEKEP